MIALTDEDIMELWEQFMITYQYNLKIINIAYEYPDTKSLVVDFAEIQKFDTDLADLLLKNPEKTLQLGEKVIVSQLSEEKKAYVIHLRIKNLPTSQVQKIRALRTKHLGEFLVVHGLVRMVTEVRPRVVVAAFKCSACGHINYIEQEDENILARPPYCEACKKVKVRFKLNKQKSKYVDSQRIEIQELPEELVGGQQPQKMVAYLEDDLTKGDIMPGKKITIYAILKPIARSVRGMLSQHFDLYLDVNNYEFAKEEYEEIEFSQADIEEIRKLSKQENLFELFRNSIAETIYGYDVIKEALLLQMFSGVVKIMPDNTRLRGDIHILLVGDPGTAKSQLLQFVSRVVPKGIYTSGKSSSAAGLTAAATKDEFGDGRWTLEAGALVLADMGIAAIDEFDKMDPKDRSAIHEAMEQQTVTIAKAGINATLMSRCGILAAANPKLGRFDVNKSLTEQINLPGPLLSRFDAIFKITDIPDPERDAKIAEHILTQHRIGEKLTQSMNRTMEPSTGYAPISAELIRKYIAYAKKINPELAEDAINTIKSYYLSMRKQYEQTKTVPITPRQLEAMIRLAEASARVRLRKYVTKEDAERAIMILNRFISDFATGDSGEYDIDRVSGIAKTQRTKMAVLDEIIRNLSIDRKSVPLEEIVREAEVRGMDKYEVEQFLEKMARDGLIYRPSYGRYALLS